jgi:uncharacterized repeat protein (TIGR01451 family)
MNSIIRNTAAGILCAFLLLPGAAWAQQQGNIELKSKAEKEVTTTNSKGEKRVQLVEVSKASKAKVLPGDIVIFTTNYKNIGKQAADKVAITNPVPKHMIYVDQSAEGKGTTIEFSVDNGKSYGMLDALFILDAQGKKQKASASDYTDIRWTLNKPLLPNSAGNVSFKAKLK